MLISYPKEGLSLENLIHSSMENTTKYTFFKVSVKTRTSLGKSPPPSWHLTQSGTSFVHPYISVCSFDGPVHRRSAMDGELSDEDRTRLTEIPKGDDSWVMSGASPSTLYGQTSCWFITVQQRAFVPRAALTTAG